jgi:hypothetical protein
MTTPSYKGQNQPPASGGGWFSSLFGGGTPAYVTAPASPPAPQTTTAQPATPQTAVPQNATSLPFLAFAAPAYKLAPALAADGSDETALAIVIPQPSSDPQQ